MRVGLNKIPPHRNLSPNGGEENMRLMPEKNVGSGLMRIEGQVLQSYIPILGPYQALTTRRFVTSCSNDSSADSFPSKGRGVSEKILR